MSHIHTEPGQHDHTASGYIVRIDTPQPAVLLHMHKKLGKYMQFGGHVELNETPWQAVRHELKEESGYDFEQLVLLQPPIRLKNLNGADLHPYPVAYLTHVFNDIHNHTDIDFAFVTNQPPKDAPGEDESQDLKLFTRQDLLDTPDAEIMRNVREICLFILDEILDTWDRLPATDWAA